MQRAGQTRPRNPPDTPRGVFFWAGHSYYGSNACNGFRLTNRPGGRTIPFMESTTGKGVGMENTAEAVVTLAVGIKIRADEGMSREDFRNILRSKEGQDAIQQVLSERLRLADFGNKAIGWDASENYQALITELTFADPDSVQIVTLPHVRKDQRENA